ncbi:sigma-70 family RNA polymerase sigma factor [Lentisphaera profundi]|uniref:Sigma-70 family RNA polymerase sigma factor n=1 Tax=Lentisphaera profundi TaxID=1658616 RepID=A0ABY7VQL7_9BACT|nr:sigma-70 family RNA polymerase sigma factor [Lentisphaera profundi]WDE96302.1 sigma-70 family RNA polymerase sigma factor [Lentisphaera profundi]
MNEKNETYGTRATLLQRMIHEKDEKSWEDFVQYYRDFIYLICRKMDMSHHDADEVVQQVLIKLWNHFPNFEYDESKRFRSWLCRVIQNTGRDFFRKLNSQSRLKGKVLDEEMDKLSLPEVENIAEHEWNDYLASLALENIKPHFSDRLIEIFLRLVEGESPQDLELEYKLKPKVIYVYSKRIRDRLKDELRRLKAELA